MVIWDEGETEQDLLAAALGTENTNGFHLELYYQTSPFWGLPRRGDGTRFPCIGAGNVYSGCLGAGCRAASCWAGRLVPSAPNAARERVALPRIERKGAACHLCAKAVGAQDGTVDCAEGHFDRPITPACLVRRRIPESAPVPCPDFKRAATLRADVAEYRRVKRACSRQSTAGPVATKIAVEPRRPPRRKKSGEDRSSCR
jgi:hypothetical protein